MPRSSATLTTTIISKIRGTDIGSFPTRLSGIIPKKTHGPLQCKVRANALSLEGPCFDDRLTDTAIFRGSRKHHYFKIMRVEHREFPDTVDRYEPDRFGPENVAVSRRSAS